MQLVDAEPPCVTVGVLGATTAGKVVAKTIPPALGAQPQPEVREGSPAPSQALFTDSPGTPAAQLLPRAHSVMRTDGWAVSGPGPDLALLLSSRVLG